jgi:hypothetical protein
MSLGDVTVAANYQTGGSILNVNGLTLILPDLNIVPNQITVYQASTYGTSTQKSGIYAITRASGSVIAGLSLVSGTDGPWVPGDFVVLQINAPAGAGSGTVTQVSGTGLLTGTVTSAGSLSIAPGTPSSLVGFNSSGVASVVTINTATMSLSGGVLSAIGGGGGGVNPGTAGQFGVYATATTMGGINASAITWTGSQITGTANAILGFSSSGVGQSVSVLAAANLPATGLTLTQYSGALITATQSGGNIPINLAAGNRFACTLSANGTVVPSGAPTGSASQSVFLEVTQATGSGPFTFTGPSGVVWVSGAAPTMPTAAGAVLDVGFLFLGSGVIRGYALSGSSSGITALTGDVTASGTGSVAAVVNSVGGVAFGSLATASAVTAAQLPTAGVLPTSLTGAGVIPAGAFPAMTGAVINTAGSLVTSIPNFTPPSAGPTIRPDGTFFSCGTCTPLASFTSAASLFGSPASPTGSLTIAANSLKVGQWLELWIEGTFGVASGSPTFTFSIVIGGVVIVSTPASVFGSAAGGPLWWGAYYGPVWQAAITAIGSSGGILGAAGGMLHLNATGAGTGVGLNSATGSVTPITINTTNSLLCDFQVACSVSAAANTIGILAAQWRIRG